MKHKLKFLGSFISRFFAKLIIEHRKHIIIFAIIFLIGFITGIFTASEYSNNLSCEYLINTYLYSFLLRDSTYITFYLTMAVYLIIIVFCICMFTRNKVMIIIFAIIFSLGSYIYGFDICIIFVSLGIAGIVLGSISFGFMGVILAFVIIVILSIASKRCTNKLTAGRFCNNFEYFKLYFSLLLVVLVVLFLICFVFNVIHIFVIVD